MKKREEISAEYTWDLSHLYPTANDWENDLAKAEELLSELMTYKGKLTADPHTLLKVLILIDELSLKLEWTASYAKMSFDVNMSEAQSKKNYELIDNLYTKVSSKLAFINPELLKLDPAAFAAYKQTVPDLDTYSFMFEKLFKLRENILKPEEEEILAQMDGLGSFFGKIFDDIVVNDLDFPEVEDSQGKTMKAGEANYRLALNSYDRSFREKYFKALLGTYGSHINSISSTFYGNVKYRNYLAKTRNYPSSRQMALSLNHIPLSVYDTLISTVRSNVHLLQRYLELRKKTLGYSELHFYDLFVPLLPDIVQTFTFEEARDTVFEALSILGDDYSKVLRQAFNERWVDVYPNKGKVSGAYANGIYSCHPYFLLNFTGTIDDVFTMAHELGHVMHSYYSNKTQPYIDSNYVIFTAEVASTVNEYLLYHHLLQKVTDKEKRTHLLSMHLDSIRSTLYRQAFFADFEMKVHEMSENGIPLIPTTLTETYHKLYAHYYGQGFTIDEELMYEWARIPHFYNSFYVYQYATGISAAIALAKRIINKEPEALSSYLKFLTRGGSDYPINLLKEAGVDMSTSAPILAALEDFSQTLDLLASSL